MSKKIPRGNLHENEGNFQSPRRDDDDDDDREFPIPLANVKEFTIANDYAKTSEESLQFPLHKQLREMMGNSSDARANKITFQLWGVLKSPDCEVSKEAARHGLKPLLDRRFTEYSDNGAGISENCFLNEITVVGKRKVKVSSTQIGCYGIGKLASFAAGKEILLTSVSDNNGEAVYLVALYSYTFFPDANKMQMVYVALSEEDIANPRLISANKRDVLRLIVAHFHVKLRFQEAIQIFGNDDCGYCGERDDSHLLRPVRVAPDVEPPANVPLKLANETQLPDFLARVFQGYGRYADDGKTFPRAILVTGTRFITTSRTHQVVAVTVPRASTPRNVYQYFTEYAAKQNSESKDNAHDIAEFQSDVAIGKQISKFAKDEVRLVEDIFMCRNDFVGYYSNVQTGVITPSMLHKVKKEDHATLNESTKDNPVTWLSKTFVRKFARVVVNEYRSAAKLLRNSLAFDAKIDICVQGKSVVPFSNGQRSLSMHNFYGLKEKNLQSVDITSLVVQKARGLVAEDLKIVVRCGQLAVSEAYQEKYRECFWGFMYEQFQVGFPAYIPNLQPLEERQTQKAKLEQMCVAFAAVVEINVKNSKTNTFFAPAADKVSFEKSVEVATLFRPLVTKVINDTSELCKRIEKADASLHRATSGAIVPKIATKVVTPTVKQLAADREKKRLQISRSEENVFQEGARPVRNARAVLSYSINNYWKTALAKRKTEEKSRVVRGVKKPRIAGKKDENIQLCCTKCRVTLQPDKESFFNSLDSQLIVCTNSQCRQSLFRDNSQRCKLVKLIDDKRLQEAQRFKAVNDYLDALQFSINSAENAEKEDDEDEDYEEEETEDEEDEEETEDEEDEEETEDEEDEEETEEEAKSEACVLTRNDRAKKRKSTK